MFEVRQGQPLMMDADTVSEALYISVL